MFYKIKQTTKDFIVTENLNLDVSEGPYVYIKLNKTDFTTPAAIKKIASFFHIKERDVGYAGNKDRHAVTTQAISVYDPKEVFTEEKINSFNSENIALEYIGRGKTPISLGALKGNSFEITLRDCEKTPKEISQMVNYFDEQRFSDVNRDVGRCIIKKDFKSAANLMQEHSVHEFLDDHKGNFVGALKTIPLRTRMIYIHAYQSWLWNEIGSELLKQKIKNTVDEEYSLGKLTFLSEQSLNQNSLLDLNMPIIGFDTDLISIKDNKLQTILNDIIKKESISLRDFIIRSLPEMSSEGSSRNLFVQVTWDKKQGITEIDKETYLIKFYLPKGSYATMLIRQLFV